MPRDEFDPSREWPPKEGWQPIGSAPKDGTEMLLYANGGAGDREYVGVGQWATAKGPGTVAGWFWSYAIRPTHWMPLPEPPK